MDYYRDQKRNKERALAHTEHMERLFPRRIANAVAASRIYGEEAMQPEELPREFLPYPEVVFLNTDSTDAVLRYAVPGKKICVLNFASYKHPGGKFIEGSSAQEESLCNDSFLYNVLRRLPYYYEWNGRHLNRSLYKNRAVYTPGVVFARGEKSALCDVLTCAAPNFTPGKKYGNVTAVENSAALRGRIRFVRNIVETEHVDVFITGAYGCGVFSQDAAETADLFREFFETSQVKIVVYAVPGDDRNAHIFRKLPG